MKAIVLLNLSLIVLASLIVSTGANAGSWQLKPLVQDNLSDVPSTFRGDDALRLQAPTGIAPVSLELSWVRGKVLSLSPDSITLKLRGGSLKLSLDADTVISVGNSSQKVISANELEVEGQTKSLAVGSIVQAHYVSRHNERRAVIIVDDALSRAKLSRRPGTSYLGVVDFADGRHVSIRGRKKGFGLEGNNRLIDRTGHLLASGGDIIARLLHAGETVLVVYGKTGDGQEGGPAYHDTVLEIRRLRPSP